MSIQVGVRVIVDILILIVHKCEYFSCSMRAVYKVDLILYLVAADDVEVMEERNEHVSDDGRGESEAHDDHGVLRAKHVHLGGCADDERGGEERGQDAHADGEDTHGRGACKRLDR